MTTSESKEQDPMKVEPTNEHRWLQKFVGEWTYEGECMMGPDQPRMTFTGTESVRAIGEIWVQGEGRGKMPDGDDATTIITLGFNPQTNRFVGTFIGSMMTHMWIYDGSLDEAGKVLTLEAEGPDMTRPGTTAVYRDVVTLESDDHRILKSFAKGPDGVWHEFMTSHYRRTR
jgi:hypothetical protein